MQSPTFRIHLRINCLAIRFRTCRTCNPARHTGVFRWPACAAMHLENRMSFMKSCIELLEVSATLSSCTGVTHHRAALVLTSPHLVASRACPSWQGANTNTRQSRIRVKSINSWLRHTSHTKVSETSENASTHTILILSSGSSLMKMQVELRRGCSLVVGWSPVRASFIVVSLVNAKHARQSALQCQTFVEHINCSPSHDAGVP